VLTAASHPLQETNLVSLPGTGVRMTLVPDSKAPVHGLFVVVGQVRPPGLLVTVPAPLPVRATVSVTVLVNLTETVRAD
jgi:hypothetical protein